jgi:hypothetical protein
VDDKIIGQISSMAILAAFGALRPATGGDLELANSLKFGRFELARGLRSHRACVEQPPSPSSS